MILKPEPLPRPGIAGGPKAKVWASWILFLNFALSLWIILAEVFSLPLSAQSLQDTKMKTELVEYPPVSML
jgi:hypothetical protein